MPHLSRKNASGSSTESSTLKARKRGFIAVVAVSMISISVLAVAQAALGAAALYSDLVDRRADRIQRTLDLAACDDTAKLIRAKDRLASGRIRIAEFECDAVL